MRLPTLLMPQEITIEQTDNREREGICTTAKLLQNIKNYNTKSLQISVCSTESLFFRPKTHLKVDKIKLLAKHWNPNAHVYS